MSANINPVPGSRADRLRETGNRFFQQKDYKRAVEFYSESLKEQNTAVVLSNRAQAYLNLEQPLLANQDANAAMKIDPRNEKAHYRYFLSLVHLGKKAEAVIALNEHRGFQKDAHDFQICSFLDQLRTPVWSTPIKDEMKINQLQIFEEDLGAIHIHVLCTDKTVLSYGSLRELRQKLADKLHNRVEFVAMTNVSITQEFMDCFCSFDPICWTGEMSFKHTPFTPNQFEILFGQCFQPYKAYFSGEIGLKSSFFFPAINRLLGLLHSDCLEINDYSMKDQMPMDEVIKYLHYQPNLSSLRRRTLFVGIAQLGSMSFSDVFQVLAQKMSTDTQPFPYLFGICGDRGQPTLRAVNENTLELLMMFKGDRGMEIMRAQKGNYVP